MIPKNIELPDSVLAELTSNPVIADWLREVQSQLVTSTIDLNGVGCTRIVWNETGADIEALETVNADSGLTPSYVNSSGVVSKSIDTLQGDWIASSGSIANGDAREMTRVS